ncbi:hypothetical protein EAH77_15940 [Ewingella americana]|uniref:Uncharacterized protein n=1 Tax=Ewingella americana TaxID=41202 RepID=A0A502GCQ7_9GAMM|nr:hypothetical protein EAH77_15940 [Ewingella americana]
MIQIRDYILSLSDSERYLTDNEKRILKDITKRVHQRRFVEQLRKCYSQLEDIRLDLESFKKDY